MNSYWIDSSKDLNTFNKLDKDYECDVLVIGAGLTGLSTSYYLSKKGLNVITIDSSNIGYKVSGNTTAKITYSHNLIYDYLIKNYGIEFAYKYLESNNNSIKNIKRIIDLENIECEFKYQDNYIYTINQEKIPSIQNEIKALSCILDFESKPLIKPPEFVTKCDLPFKIAGGIRIKDQAQFHPRKYLLGLANCIRKNKGLIFINSPIIDIKKENDLYISYGTKYNIKSKYVAICTHYPFINIPGFYFLKMFQETSYAILIESKKPFFDGMYINTDKETLSFRTTNNNKYLIIGGGNHKTGILPKDTEKFGYKYLENIAKKHFPESNILYRWNTQDCISLDRIPYIGRFSNLMPNIYVATGFNKWGMTTSNVAANIIKDCILEKENKYLDIYDSTRLKPYKNKKELASIIKQSSKSLIIDKFKVPNKDLDKIPKNHGKIIKVDGKNIGVYKDNEGKTYLINPTCTHLGCLLSWNDIDKTWDCPCHGSRFLYNGKNIYDPSFKDLKKL